MTQVTSRLRPANLRERARRWVRIHVAHSQSRDLYYPGCDAHFGPLKDARIEFDGPRSVPGEIYVNGRLARLRGARKEGHSVSADLVPDNLVVPGENVLSLPIDCDPRAVRLTATPDQDAGARLGWAGGSVARFRIADPHVAAAAMFLANSLSRDAFGPGVASLTGWDPQQGCVRLWSWYWTTGIVYEALSALVTDGQADIDLQPLEEGMLGRQVLTDGEARGSYFVRWDPDRTAPCGVRAWHAPNDAAYLGLHGLLVAHRRTGDAIWLQRAELLAGWIAGPGMQGSRLRVGWDANRGQWDDSWHYIDAAWTPAFLCDLAARTEQKQYRDLAVNLAHDTIDRFATEGPFYLKIWRANGRHTRTVFSRGMAWVLEGWIPLLQDGEEWLRPRVRDLATGLLAEQRPDGAWPYLIDQPGSGPCNKGTPAIAYHLNRLKPLLPEMSDALELAVSRALAWCERNMEMSMTSPGRGGIIAANAEGAITTVRGIPVAFNYASAYYILTRRERAG